MFSGEMKGIAESSLLPGGGNRVCLSLFNTCSNNTQAAITHKSKSVTVFPPLLRTLLTIFSFEHTAQVARLSFVGFSCSWRRKNWGLNQEPFDFRPSPPHTGHSLFQQARSLYVYTSTSIEDVRYPNVSFNPGTDAVTFSPAFQTLAASRGHQQKCCCSSMNVTPEVHLHLDIIANLLRMWVKGQRPHIWPMSLGSVLSV